MRRPVARFRCRCCSNQPKSGAGRRTQSSVKGLNNKTVSTVELRTPEFGADQSWSRISSRLAQFLRAGRGENLSRGVLRPRISPALLKLSATLCMSKKLSGSECCPELRPHASDR